ncbi:RDD family protein [Coralliovum pocilloporae]|uniref:RDD family protein n=1 Tax=Coralliovum pocilloporae TaxID=3066369 RepID=UPI0033075235
MSTENPLPQTGVGISRTMTSGVRTRRMMAFVVDAIIIAVLTSIMYVVVAVLGIVTLSLGWLLFPAVFPCVALLYNASTLGSRDAATIGMRLMGLQVRFEDGASMTMLQALAHTLLFYVSVTILTPFVLLLSLFTRHKQLLHDLLLGVIAVNSDQ